MTTPCQKTHAATRLPAAVGQSNILEKAWKMVRASGGSAGVDNHTIAMFEQDWREELGRIGQQLARGKYRFSKLRPAAIPKRNGQTRRLGIPTVQNRIVLQGLRIVLEPTCERKMLDCSHAYRAGRGAMTALESIARALKSGRHFVAETDIRDFFDSIRHKPLRRQLNRLDRRTHACPLIDGALKMNAGRWPARKGVAQGSPLSPLLANLALLNFDQVISNGPWTLVRYADDLVLLGDTLSSARQGLEAIGRELARIKLVLHPDKTRIVDSRTDTFAFLGFALHPDRIAPTSHNLAKFRDGITAWCNPHSQVLWQDRLERINGLIRSFAWYYHQTDSSRLFWTLDQFVEERLTLLEVEIGPPKQPWQDNLVKMSRMRDVAWRGSGRKRKTKGWNGYG